MTPKDTLEALAGRVEAATGADDNAGRVLGREVLLACGKGYVSPLYAWHNPVLSLDAAMTLVPEGWFTTIIRDPAGISYAGVAGHPDSCGPPCATPALALTAAALRARAAMEAES